MAKKTTTKSKTEVPAKRAITPTEKPKAVATPPPKVVAAPKAAAPPPPEAAVAPPPKAIAAPAPVESKPSKAAVKPKRVVKKAAPKPQPPSYTQEDVALRAYFISEKRRSHGLPGDEHQDWLEAERQIIAESSKKKTAKKA